MACVVIEGLIAVVLVLAGLREAIMRAIPHEVKLSIGVGIGLFIALVGFRDAGITVNNPATGIGLGVLTAGAPLVALGGLLVMIVLTARGVRGAILIGIVASTVLGLIFGVLEPPDKVAQIPSSDDFSTIGDALAPSNLADALTWALVPVIFVLFVTDFFDTIGTAVAVSSAGGLLDESGKPPRLKRLLLVDSAAAAGGGAMGVSSVTTYVESGAGVAEGARTGLASVVTAVCFLLTIFFVPLIAVVGQTVIVGEAQCCTRPSRPALIMIGYLMIRLVADVDWSRPEAGIPAFLVIAGVPLTFSISAGIGFGVLGYVAVMVGDRPRPRDPPADVGAGAAVRGVLRVGLAERERLLGTDDPRAGSLAQAAAGSRRRREHAGGTATAMAMTSSRRETRWRPIQRPGPSG